MRKGSLDGNDDITDLGNYNKDLKNELNIKLGNTEE